MTNKQIITEFNEKCHLAVESGGFLRFPLGKDKVVFLDERLMGLYVVSVLEKQEKTAQKIVARLAVEVMEVTLQEKGQKEYNTYNHGHIHGVNRAIYLIKNLSFQGNVTEEEKQK